MDVREGFPSRHGSARRRAHAATWVFLLAGGLAIAGCGDARPTAEDGPVRVSTATAADRPGAPRAVTMSAEGGVATVTWQPPADSHGVDGFRLWFDTDEPVDLAVDVLTYSVGDLAPGSWHQVRVASLAGDAFSVDVVAETRMARAAAPAPAATSAAPAAPATPTASTPTAQRPPVARPQEGGGSNGDAGAPASETGGVVAAPPPAPPAQSPQDAALAVRGVQVTGATLLGCREWSTWNPETEKDVTFAYAVRLVGGELSALRVAGPGVPDRDAGWLQQDGTFHTTYRLLWSSAFPGDVPPLVTVSTVDVYDSASGQWYRDVTVASPVTFGVPDCAALY